MPICLNHLQDEFQRYLLRGDQAIVGRVLGTNAVPVGTRLAIYGGGYGARLSEALQANFPMLAKLLGEADFETLAAEYVRSHDSTFASIRYYGGELARFLEQEPLYAEIPVLAELAQWEWAMTEVFDAADAQPIDLTAMSPIPPDRWPELRFEWHPAVRRLALAWNVPPIWKSLTSDDERPEMEFAAQPGQWLLWRRELEIYFRSLTPAEAAALDAARSGCSFGELCDVLCAWTQEAAAPAQAAGFLREWLQSGLITGILLG